MFYFTCDRSLRCLCTQNEVVDCERGGRSDCEAVVTVKETLAADTEADTTP